MPGTFFDRLAADERRIAVDCDVVAGPWTSRADLDTSPEAVARILERGGIDGALVSSAQAIWYDEAGGGTELRGWAGTHGWSRCNAVNLRDTVGIGERLDAWLADGVRAIRLPSSTQGIAPGSPSYTHVASEAARRGLLILAEGEFATVQGAFRGLGAKVVFVDAGYYQMSDFLLAAKDEPHFVASTRRMLGPDSMEIICSEVGSSHLAFGSGSPLQDLEPTVWRLRDARIPAEDFDAVAGGTITTLLEV